MSSSASTNMLKHASRTRPIFVEGPDGSGKSTLLRQLSEDLALPIFHTGGPPKTKNELLDRLGRIEETRFKNLFDRAPYISEIIYRTAEGGTLFVPQGALLDRFASLRPLVVYCYLSSPGAMEKQISQSPKAHKSPQHLEMVLRQYPKIIAHYNLIFSVLKKQILVLPYDWQRDRYSQLLETIKCAAWSLPHLAMKRTSRKAYERWLTGENPVELE